MVLRPWASPSQAQIGPAQPSPAVTTALWWLWPGLKYWLFSITKVKALTLFASDQCVKHNQPLIHSPNLTICTLHLESSMPPPNAWTMSKHISAIYPPKMASTSSSFILQCLAPTLHLPQLPPLLVEQVIFSLTWTTLKQPISHSRFIHCRCIDYGLL